MRYILILFLLSLTGCATQTTLCEDMPTDDCRALIHHLMRARGIEPVFKPTQEDSK